MSWSGSSPLDASDICEQLTFPQTLSSNLPGQRARCCRLAATSRLTARWAHTAATSKSANKHAKPSDRKYAGLTVRTPRASLATPRWRD